MAFIREKTEERTGYQIGNMPTDSVDNGCDFVMVYRLDEDVMERIEVFKQKGYVIHFMTGISWGRYLDYLNGEYDGRDHWDEVQTDRFGNQILHGVNVPYMVPTVAFADYLSKKLRVIVDAGVEAIHVEEPEFWDRAGYSEAFKREYELYYREKWTPPHESLDASFRCAKLKAYLFTRTIDRLSSSLKEYAKTEYNKNLRFYVPTHSLLNYTQWKIISPEGKLSDIPGVDGCIAQVWTGTSREKNWFNGSFKERTFETAYLEYGVMQELVKGTGRQMWFLHDPIEDNPEFDWTDYRKNYLCTVAASLLHPKVNSYEICPWPNRVFDVKYPKDSPAAEKIPAAYATVLNNTFNTLGTLEAGEQKGLRVGILTGDCQLYQRTYPDSEYNTAAKEITGTVLREDDEIIKQFTEKLFTEENPDKELMLRFLSSNAFPAFYGLALPLLKYGVPVRPVLIDNARRYTGYLDDYDVLILSYEYMKPDFPDINNSIAEWVKRGGQLIYAGNGFDPFYRIKSWWSEKYNSPAEHLFDMLGVLPKQKKELLYCGNGTVSVIDENPCIFSFSQKNADVWRSFFTDTLALKNRSFEFCNRLIIERERYIIAGVMDESLNDDPLVLKGLFADMFSPEFEIKTEVTAYPGERLMLCDLSKVKEPLEIIGTSVRINSVDQKDGKITLKIYGASDFEAKIRIKVPKKPQKASIDSLPCDINYDEKSCTALLSFESITGNRTITIE